MDLIKGGKGDKYTPRNVDSNQLTMGIKVEMEHTNNKQLAQEIALDHLAEDPMYYTKLKKVHKENLKINFLKKKLEEITKKKVMLINKR